MAKNYIIINQKYKWKLLLEAKATIINMFFHNSRNFNINKGHKNG